MSAGDNAGYTIDELAAAVGMTVRTTRYYVSLGLIPPPVRRGRMAIFDDSHLARLETVQTLQACGFTLKAIERYLGSLPPDTSVDELAVQRAMVASSWTLKAHEQLTRKELEDRGRRALTDPELDLLHRLGLVRTVETDEGDRYIALQGFETAAQVLDLGLKTEGLIDAGDAISRHMQALAEDLTVVLNEQVVRPFRSGASHTRGELVELEQTISALRRLTLDAIVGAFQRSADEIIERSFDGRTAELEH